MRILGPSNNGISFANIDSNDDNEHALKNGQKTKKEWLKDKVNITCHHCGQKGHYTNKCNGIKPKKTEQEAEATLVMAGVATKDFKEADHVHFQFLMTASYANYRSVVLNQPSGAVPKAWILLDNQSTVNVLYNKDLLRNVRRSNKHMDIHCNAGVTSTNLIGDLPGYGQRNRKHPIFGHGQGETQRNI
jgi:hypothetical protein